MSSMIDSRSQIVSGGHSGKELRYADSILSVGFDPVIQRSTSQLPVAQSLQISVHGETQR